ncbi:MAG: flagellar FliJ family protein, partial [Bdellovibrionales bacterium]|nr:flagellar FliJ family protein [Bdellovibrionales bacterium]
QEQVDLALQDYIEATREAKVLETLKEKKREQYMEYVRKEEDKFLDELTVQRAGFTPR